MLGKEPRLLGSGGGGDEERGKCPGELGVTEHTSHPVPVRAAAGGAGPFVAVRAAEPVSSRMRRGARSGGERGTPCGEPGGAPVSPGWARLAQSVEESPSALVWKCWFPETALSAECWAKLTVLPGVEAREKRKRLSLGLVEQLVKLHACLVP